MSINFINSETVKINGKDNIYLRDPVSILKHLESLLREIGPEKFFSSPKEEVKKARESLAGLYFLLALQSQSKKRLFLMQPENDPPDFIIMKLGDRIEDTLLDQVELVEIPSRCKSFDQALSIVNGKINKGYSVGYHLLVFINNENSKIWIRLLNHRLKNYHPFKSVWTINLLAAGDDYWPVVNRLRPLPRQYIESKLESITLPAEMPDFMEEIEVDGSKFLRFKPDITKDFIQKIRKDRLAGQ